MGSAGTYALLCCIIISLGHFCCVMARPNNPIVVPRGQRKNFANDHVYFIGKRGPSGTSSTADDYSTHLRLTDERIADAFLQNQCFSDDHCPDTHCCALFQGRDHRRSSFGYFRHPMAQCMPLGFNGEMCFYNEPGTLGIGCGCAPGLKCVTFAGYGFGICVEDK